MPLISREGEIVPGRSVCHLARLLFVYPHFTYPAVHDESSTADSDTQYLVAGTGWMVGRGTPQRRNPFDPNGA